MHKVRMKNIKMTKSGTTTSDTLTLYRKHVFPSHALIQGKYYYTLAKMPKVICE